MCDVEYLERWRRRPALRIVILATALALAGCSGAGTNSSSSSSFADIFNPSAAPDTTAQAAADKQTTVSFCPPVDIRSGTSSLSFNTPGAEGAMALRYQATVAQTARECHTAGGNLTMKVGVQGRIILGPAGGPGKIEVPLRFALVHDGPTPKTLWTKMYRVPVEIPEDAPHVTFSHVEEDLTVPMPGGADIESYIVYVGFDPLGAKEQPAKKKPPQRRTRPAG
jgi:hypothetical protein